VAKCGEAEAVWIYLTMAVSSTASVAITRVRRVRELHVVVIFDLAFWSANPPGLRHGRVTTRARRNVLGAVASDTHSYGSMFFSLFTRGLILPGLSHIFVHLFPLFVLYYIQVSGSAWSVAKQDGDAACSTTQRSWNLGTVWDGLGRLRKISRTVWDQSKWKTLKTVQGTRCLLLQCAKLWTVSLSIDKLNRDEQEPSTNLRQIYLLDGRLLNTLHRLDSSIFPGKMSNLPWSKLKLATTQFKSRLAHLRKPTWD
jgi:hypothetical protein